MGDADVATAISLVIITVALTVITYFYMRETRLMRKAGQVPSFSSEPSAYVLGGGFLTLDLVNNGQTATGIHVECSWEDSVIQIYFISLSTGGRARLEGLPIMQIEQNNKKLTVSLSCKDARGQPYGPSVIEIDFEKIKAEKRQIVYQYNDIGGLTHKLEDIKRVLDDLKRSLALTK